MSSPPDSESEIVARPHNGVLSFLVSAALHILSIDRQQEVTSLQSSSFRQRGNVDLGDKILNILHVQSLVKLEREVAVHP